MVAHFNPIKYVKFNSQKELVATVSQVKKKKIELSSFKIKIKQPGNIY